ncbi:restriction endonuclease subunit S [Pseudolactococcus insecticola]|uniref:Type I restriction modification DNA specificity domain-containing protein n=1 Tax=Pseudolactococcus insecticola TaxID=2709158 RepID=A0A6A0B2X1_9LACT|nr:restriction endonuclease subunit S [Lactococcus insecticola]GFH39669.1 hypothetical protein Hs20B_00670 [Lactococcus insecticola]
MDKRRISEFVTFVPGINPTRIEKRFGIIDINYYDQASFDQDFNHKDGFIDETISNSITEGISLESGDVVISNAMQIATIVGVANSGKIPSLNFTKVEFSSEGLDKLYFIYLFNAYSDVRRQKERELQGTGSILRIPIKALNEIVVPIVSLEQQHKIGKAYNEMIKTQSKLNKYAALMEQFVGTVLEENLKEKK